MYIVNEQTWYHIYYQEERKKSVVKNFIKKKKRHNIFGLKRLILGLVEKGYKNRDVQGTSSFQFLPLLKKSTKTRIIQEKQNPQISIEQSGSKGAKVSCSRKKKREEEAKEHSNQKEGGHVSIWEGIRNLGLRKQQQKQNPSQSSQTFYNPIRITSI